VGGASFAVIGVCFVNPYGFDGALFPLLLYPKVTATNNLYKLQIDEFMNVPQYLSSLSLDRAANLGKVIALHFLLILLPVSFFLPAIRLATQASAPAVRWARKPTSRLPFLGPRGWLPALPALATLLACTSLTLSATDRPAAFVALGQTVPLLLCGAAVAGSILSLRHSLLAAGLTLVAGVAEASWTLWLNEYLTGAGSSAAADSWRTTLAGLALVTGLLAAVPVLYLSGGFFRILVATTFTYFGLSGINSLGRLGLVVGVVLSWNLSPWVASLAASLPAARWRSWAGSCLWFGLAGLLLAWTTAIVTHSLP